MQTGGIPSALSLKILTISLRSRTTRPPFLKPFAICITLLTLRAEYTEMLQTQLERGNNGLIKTKFLTFTIEAKDIKSARARLARIETDTLNHFKVIGAAARVLDGKQRLEVLHGLFHPDGERFNFAWEWLPVSGLSVKDFIAPSSFRFGDGRMFQMGGKFGAVSFLQIAAPELSDRMLADFMEAENGTTKRSRRSSGKSPTLTV